MRTAIIWRDLDYIFPDNKPDSVENLVKKRGKKYMILREKYV